MECEPPRVDPIHYMEADLAQSRMRLAEECLRDDDLVASQRSMQAARELLTRRPLYDPRHPQAKEDYAAAVSRYNGLLSTFREHGIDLEPLVSS